MKQLVEFFSDKTIKSVLDVGTGTGDFLKVLQQTFPHSKITGVDPNQESLKEASQKFDNVHFANMKAEKLTFNDNTFDVASISMALHHLSNVQKALSEMKRVVKPGGWVIVNELYSDNLNPAQEVHKMVHHFKSAIQRKMGIIHNQTFKKKQIIDEIKKADIEIKLAYDFIPGNKPMKKDIDTYVSEMEEMLLKLNNDNMYKQLKPDITKFKTLAKKHGFQSATRVVIAGQVNV